MLKLLSFILTLCLGTNAMAGYSVGIEIYSFVPKTMGLKLKTLDITNGVIISGSPPIETVYGDGDLLFIEVFYENLEKRNPAELLRTFNSELGTGEVDSVTFATDDDSKKITFSLMAHENFQIEPSEVIEEKGVAYKNRGMSMDPYRNIFDIIEDIE